MVESGVVARLGLHLLGRLIVRSQGCAGGGLVRLPCVYVTTAEYMNAAFDERSIGLDDIPPGRKEAAADPWKELREHGYDQWPTLCVPIEPKVGFGKDPMDRARAILRHLEKQFRIPDFLSEEEKFERANERVRALAEPGFGAGGRWFYLFVPGGQDDSVQKLVDVLPALRICALDAAQAISDEEALMAEFTKFYARKRKRMANE